MDKFSEYTNKTKARRNWMGEKELRKSLSVFPIGTVMKLTDLSARQIRYYEEQGLIKPQRSEGNRRLFSLNDIDVLLEIKDYLADGLNMAGIKRMYELKQKEKQAEKVKKPLTDKDVRRIFYDEMMTQSRLNQQHPYRQNNRML